MSDDHTAPERATIKLVYDLVSDLDAKLRDRLDEVESGVRQEIRDTVGELRSAIDALREEIPTRRECQYRHEEVDAAIIAAIRASEDDRGKLWAAIHAVEGQLKWAAGIIITAFLGVIVYLMQGHITP
jgi:hypothetical protein